MKKKILVYSFNDQLGDGLQKVAFIQELKKVFNNSYIIYSTSNKTSLRTYLRPLIDGYIDEFIEYNEIKSSITDLIFKKNTKLGNIKFDLIIDLQKVVLRTLNLKKIPHEVFISPAANFFFSNIKNYKKNIMKNIYVERFYFNLLSLISGNNYKKIPEMIISNKFHVNFDIQPDTSKNIGIAPGAGDKKKTWPFESYLEIGKYLRNRNYNVYFFLGPDEKNLLKSCLNNGFLCPEWKNGEKISNDILSIMNLAKKMSCLLCNDSGTSWMFEFACIKTFKIFGITNEKKFARPEYCTPLDISKFGKYKLNNFPIEIYKEQLNIFLHKINEN